MRNNPGGKKQVKFGYRPSDEKNPVIPRFETDNGVIQFSFGWFDGTFKPKKSGKGNKSDVWKIIGSLKSIEDMTWVDMAANDKKHHAVTLNKISKQAKKALRKTKRDDVDELWSLSISGPQRLWAIKYNNHCMILWWDPEHLVCPTLK